jgi:hypothetical protein
MTSSERLITSDAARPTRSTTDRKPERAHEEVSMWFVYLAVVLILVGGGFSLGSRYGNGDFIPFNIVR